MTTLGEYTIAKRSADDQALRLENDNSRNEVRQRGNPGAEWFIEGDPFIWSPSR